jgi:hypothetical protein
MRGILHIAVKAAIAMMAVMLMACQCDQPVPPEPTPPDPPDTRSESLKAFLTKTELGLYVDSEGMVTYDERYFQKAWSTEAGSFRIQRDDQSAYFNIRSSANSASSSYQVEYMNENHSVTLMLLKLQLVQSENSCVWLWNETMKTGVIVPEGILP